MQTRLEQDNQSTVEEKDISRSSTKNLAVILFDIDGCLFHDIPENKPVEEWIIEKNKALLDKFVKKIFSQGYDKVILGYSTLRQSFEIDQANRKPSCSLVLPILQHYIQSELTKLGSEAEVVFDPFWTTDIYANEKNGGVKQAGDSYKLALQEFKNKTPALIHSRGVCDRTKMSLIYAHAHRAAYFHPEANIDITVVDDSLWIYDKGNLYSNTLKAADKILPKSTINFILYSGEDSGQPYQLPIKASGKTLPQYDWGVRYLWACHNLFDADEVKTAEKLKQLHKENFYFVDRDYLTMDVTFNKSNVVFIDKLQKFSFEGCESTLGDNPNYLTAEMLVNQKLIPSSFLVGKPKDDRASNTFSLSDPKNCSLSFIQSGMGIKKAKIEETESKLSFSH